MGNGSGVSRGDRNRNARLGRLRELVPPRHAIVGIDLADAKQMVVVTDHDSQVLARRTFWCKAWDLGVALDWAVEQAARAGFAGVSVACEPTGHRWRVLGELAAQRGMPFVCVQPLVVSWARRTEDLTADKTDEKDAVLIARLAGQLRCYPPEPVDETWGRLRHLGAYRERLTVDAVAQTQQIRDLLECVWPAALTAAAKPFRSRTWTRALAVVVDHDHGDLDRTRRLGLARFERLVRREIGRRGGQRPCMPIARRLFTALTDPAGVPALRAGALERIALTLADWHTTQARLDDVQTRMTGVLDQLGLTGLVTSIAGLSAVGAATILAQTGDLTHYPSARAVVKHAGLAPREKLSGPTPGAPSSPGRAVPGCGWPPTAPPGRRCAPTVSTPPATTTSPAGRPTRSNPPRPRPSSPPDCCASCMPWSPAGSAGTPTWPPTAPAADPQVR